MSLFGAQSAASSQPGFGSTPSLFGGPAQSSASLFGNPQSSSSFGAPQQSSAAGFGGLAQSGSLFGGGQQSSAPLFGAPAQSISIFGTPAQSSASLFGAPAQSSSSLFGAPQSSSLFGAGAQSSSSLFGAAPQSTSLFGAPAQSSQALFAPTTQQPQGNLWQGNQGQSGAQPGSQGATPEITGRTRISQLPQNFQTDLFAVERHLRDQRTKGSQLWSKRSNVEADTNQVQARAANVTRHLVKLKASLESLRANSDTLKAAVRTERASAEPVVVALNNLSKVTPSTQVGFLANGNGVRYHGTEGRMHDRTTHVPEDYFARILEELESRANEYKSEIDEIAEFLRSQGVVLSSTSGANGSAMAARRSPVSTQMGLLDGISRRHVDMGITAAEELVTSRGKTIEEIIRRQYEYFMVVASHIADVHENLRSTREQFLQLLRSRDPDALNPFQQADLREKAEKERQRMIVDRRASEGSGGMGGLPPHSSSQPSFLQSQSGAFASSSSAFGMTSLGGGSGGLFGSSGGNGFGGSANDGNGSQGRRTSGSRRRRS